MAVLLFGNRADAGVYLARANGKREVSTSSCEPMRITKRILAQYAHRDIREATLAFLIIGNAWLKSFAPPFRVRTETYNQSFYSTLQPQSTLRPQEHTYYTFHHNMHQYFWHPRLPIQHRDALCTVVGSSVLPEREQLTRHISSPFDCSERMSYVAAPVDPPR